MDNDRVGNSQADKRADYRLTGRARVVLEVESDDPGSGMGARTIAADTRDLSAGGIRIETSEPVTVGALLPVRVQLNPSQPFHELAVDVMWCERREEGQDRWLVGLKVIRSESPAFVDWVEAVAVALSDG